MPQFTRKEVHDEVIDIVRGLAGSSVDIDESYSLTNVSDVVGEAETRFGTFFVEGFEKVKTVGDFIDVVAGFLKMEGRLGI